MPIRETVREEDIANILNVLPANQVDRFKRNLVSTILSEGYKEVDTYHDKYINNTRDQKNLQAYELWEEMRFRYEDMLIYDGGTIFKKNNCPVLKVAIRSADDKNCHLVMLVIDAYYKTCGDTPKEHIGRAPSPGTKVYAFAREI